MSALHARQSNFRMLTPTEVEIVSGGRQGVSIYGSAAHMEIYAPFYEGGAQYEVSLSNSPGGGQNSYDAGGKVVIILDDGPGHYSSDGDTYYDSRGIAYKNFEACVQVTSENIRDDRAEWTAGAFPWPFSGPVQEMLELLDVTPFDLQEAALICN